MFNELINTRRFLSLSKKRLFAWKKNEECGFKRSKNAKTAVTSDWTASRISLTKSTRASFQSSIMQISAPFCFDRGRHLERSFAATKLLAGHSVCLWRYAPISMWRWIIFFIFVDVLIVSQFSSWTLYSYNINTWSLCEGKHHLKLIRGLSALQTSMMLPTLLRSVTQRTTERWRERWRSIRTSCLPPEAESG